jgi:uncharacterized protein (DUF58 family)
MVYYVGPKPPDSFASFYYAVYTFSWIYIAIAGVGAALLLFGVRDLKSPRIAVIAVIIATFGSIFCIMAIGANVSTGVYPYSAMSIDSCIINSNTQITVILRNSGSSNLTVDTAYVDGVLQNMSPASVALSPMQTQEIIITGTNTTWKDGSLHAVKIVASDGTPLYYNFS